MISDHVKPTFGLDDFSLIFAVITKGRGRFMRPGIGVKGSDARTREVRKMSELVPIRL